MFLQQNQTEEVQMAAQGRMEADDIIQELKKQKRVIYYFFVDGLFSF